MSSDGRHSGAGGGAPEPTVSQSVQVAGKARALVAGRNQYIVTPGNVFSVTVPVVLVIISFLIYQAGGRAPQASGSPAPVGHGARFARAAPLKVTLSYDQNHVDNGVGPCVTWFVPRPIAAIQAPRFGGLDETSGHQLGGIDENGTNFKIDVQGTTPSAVELIDFRVVDIVRTPVSGGTILISSAGCGPAPEAGFMIGLGSDPPAIVPAPQLDNGSAKKIPFPFVVSSTDIQQFQIAALYSVHSPTAACNCLVSWRLALDWSYEGKAGTTVIDDNGKPFQTVFIPLASNKFGLPWYDSAGTWRRI